VTLIILDRDGVINQDSDAFIKSAEEWLPIPGSIEAIARFCHAGYTVAVATNQSGLGRGYFSQADLDAMHHKLSHLVGDAGGQIAGIYFCPHKPEDGCSCRKPLPGLLDQIRQDLGLADLQGVANVGDSIRDLQAAVARGCVPILVRTGKGRGSEATLQRYPELANAKVFDDLSAVADFLLGNQKSS
jgi:D-glycero-D-manno-heptose 1,7-bisphosphate phosphatase